MKRKLSLLIAATLLAACTATEVATEPELSEVDVANAELKEAHPLGLTRLTQEQYRKAIHQTFGDDVIVAQQLEPDLSIDGSVALGSAEAALSAFGVEGFEGAAFEIVDQVLKTEADLTSIFGCGKKLSATFDTGCARSGLAQVGKILWRRPLTDLELDGSAEVTGLVGVVETAAYALGDTNDTTSTKNDDVNFFEGMKFGLAALLQSPYFIYKVELGEPDPTQDGRLRFTNYEIATRLSLFLWNTVPDAALIEKADAGALVEIGTLKETVNEMIEDPRAKDGMRAFFTDMLELHELDGLSKDPTLFEHFNADVGPAAREETLRLLEYIAFDLDTSYLSVFTADYSFLDRRLAAIYAVPTDSDSGFAKVDYPANGERRGLLGHVSVLAHHSHPRDSSATLRGRFIRETLLCGTIPPPPSDVDTSIPEPDATSPTLRDRIKTHLSVDQCASCHSVMDPIGLGLENYDALGRYRGTENGARIDASGSLDGVSFGDPVELGQAVAEHPDAPVCVVRNMVRYVTNKVEGRAQRGVETALTDSFAFHRHRIKPLMAEVAVSPVFRYASAPTDTVDE